MVFDKFEAWTFATPAAPEISASAQTYWSQRGYQLQSTGPTAFQGRSFRSKIGIYRVVDVTVRSSGAGAVVHLRYRADIRPEVAAGGVVVAVLLFPVAVVGAAISWHEYERDWSEERWDFWNFLLRSAKATPATATPPPPPPPPALGSSPSSPPTAAASTPAAPPSSPAATRPVIGASVCPACAAPVTGEGKFCASCGAVLPQQ